MDSENRGINPGWRTKIKQSIGKKLSDFINPYATHPEVQENPSKNIFDLPADDPKDPYKRAQAEYEINQRFNRFWKINPGEVADFYLLEPLLFRNPNYYPEDSENVILLRMQERINAFGQKLSYATLSAIMREQAGASIFSDNVTDTILADMKHEFCSKNIDLEVANRIAAHYLEAAVFNNHRPVAKSGEDIRSNPNVVEKAVRYHLLEWKRKIQDVEAGKITPDEVFTDK